MKFLTDENIATSVAKFLRSQHHDVKDVKEEKLFGANDMELLGISVKENRIILTHDKDFANISHNRHIGHSGILILRLFDQSPTNVVEKLKRLFKEIPEKKLSTSVIIIREDYIEID